MEAEIQEYRRKYDLAVRDYSILESKEAQRSEEINRLSNRVFSLEGENCDLKNELERYRRENTQSWKDQLQTKEAEALELKKEIETANDIIRKLRQEASELKDFRTSHTSELARLKGKNGTLFPGCISKQKIQAAGREVQDCQRGE